ncbi:MAG: methyltransferase [Gammaproteobacteria bacterium]|nr:methyltransferase [Gammaproteobacteria bacterium]
MRLAIAVLAALALALAACQPANESTDTTTTEVVESGVDSGNNTRLMDILTAQPEEAQARYQYRHPQETIEFFGIEPGMTVVEGLPGGGYYTKILLPYLGADGRVIGADYALDMYRLFPFGTDEFIAKKETWTTDFVTDAAEWAGEDGASATGFHFGSMPDDLAGTADAVFFTRVLHNLARFESEGDFLSIALENAFKLLKPGGTFGVVQHQARDEMPDSFADGSHGYLKKAFVIAAIEQAGFEFVAESPVNENPADQPAEDDIVWRLPPSLATSRDNPELLAELTAVGESNRMTLKFRKPE